MRLELEHGADAPAHGVLSERAPGCLGDARSQPPRSLPSQFGHPEKWRQGPPFHHIEVMGDEGGPAVTTRPWGEEPHRTALSNGRSGAAQLSSEDGHQRFAALSRGHEGILVRRYPPMPVNRTGALLGCATGDLGDGEEGSRGHPHLAVGSLQRRGGEQISHRRLRVCPIDYGKPHYITVGPLCHKQA